jgi:hypothetical protein
MKATPLNKTLVVHSEKLLPSKPPKANPWKQFNRFIADANSLLEFVEAMNELRFDPSADSKTAADVEDEAEECQALVAKCRAGFESFERADLYHEDEDGERVLKHEHISKRLGIMLDSIPNTNLGNPEVFLVTMTEHVAAVDGLTDYALESACREIEETHNPHTPSTPEVVKAVKEHIRQWSARRWAMEKAEDIRLRLIEVLREREEEKAKQKHEGEVQVAIFEVRDARRADAAAP